MEEQKFNPGDIVLFVEDTDHLYKVVPVKILRVVQDEKSITYDLGSPTFARALPSRRKNLFTIEEWEECYKIFLSRKISDIGDKSKELLDSMNSIKDWRP